MHFQCRPLLLVVLAWPWILAGQGADAPAGAAKQEAKQQSGKTEANRELSTEEMYDLGKSLFDTYATDEIKQEYEFPTREQWNAFVPQLQKAMEGNSLEDLAALEPQARIALQFLEDSSEGADLADWLRERLDLIEAARDLSKPAATPPKPVPVPIPQPGPAPAKAVIPGYSLWLQRLQGRPTPDSASYLMPVLRGAFVREGLPPELAWLAEAESDLNPSARSPAGAKGLFQIMPDTAKELGLSTWLPDERTNPEKSARAAARLLKGLHSRLGNWPLALAAYNAGEGRVRRALAKNKAGSFAEIADSLPVETRLYVPKVLALVRTRSGLEPEKLSAPSS